MQDRKKIIFIAASARSGSSIFETHLSKKLDCIVIGEARWFWKRGVIDDEKCSCDNWFSECPFWKLNSFSKDKNFAKKMEQHKIFFDRFINIVPFFIPFLQSKEWTLLWKDYANGLNNFYNEVAQSRSIIIDSSKRPFYFIVLKNALADFDFFFINFIRDSRGVVHSWSKDKIRVESRKKEKMTKYGWFKASIFWNAYTIINSIVAFLFKESISINYEDFCQNPDKTIKKVYSKANFDNQTKKTIPLLHSVSGNPSRFSGSDAIKKDEAWKERSAIWKLLVSCTTFIGKIFTCLRR